MTPEQRAALVAERELLLRRCATLEQELRSLPDPSSAYADSEYDSERCAPTSSEVHDVSTTPHATSLTLRPCGDILPVHEGHGDVRDTPSHTRTSLILVLVGLPGRGKSYIAKRMCRWMNWRGITTRVFNAGNYRRSVLGVHETSDAGFFDPGNASACALRERMAQLAMSDLILFVKRHPDGVGILDATNTTRERRQSVVQTLHPYGDLLFIESVCTDTKIIHANVKRAKCFTEDFATLSETEVLRQFYSRIAHYEKVYHSMCCIHERHLSFVQMTNVKSEIILHGLRGARQSLVALFLMNLPLTDHPVFLTRSGWSEQGMQCIYGHDSSLTPEGVQYAHTLRRFITRLGYPHVHIMTSPMRRAMETRAVFQDSIYGHMNSKEEEVVGGPHTPTPRARDVNGLSPQHPPTRTHFTFSVFQQLRELEYGDFTGKTHQECMELFPTECALLEKDPFEQRYPNGESVRALCHRLEPMLLEIQPVDAPTLVISHSRVLQIMHAFLQERTPSDSIYGQGVPLGCVVEARWEKNTLVTHVHSLLPASPERLQESEL